MSTTISIKLSEPSGLTRRVNFPALPNWHALASRVTSLYGIPTENVSVSYLDTDNDLVTLSSQEELDDYYTNFFKAGDIIKFTVQDLTSARLSRSISQTQAPHSANVRNTFGIGAFDIEDDWQIPIQPIPDLGGVYFANSPNDTQPHAFVETVDSDAGTVTNRQESNHDRASQALSIHSNPESPFLVPSDKGKAKAFIDDDDVSSTGSVLAEDAPPKHPVHVYDMSFRDDDAIESHSHNAVDTEPTPGPTDGRAESTAKTDIQTRSVTGAAVGAAEDIGTPSDPPLPSFESEGASQPLSLTSDIATLFSTLSTVIGTHPELSDEIRNITRNTVNGAYWRHHREAMSRAAQDIARETGKTADTLRETEAEAGRRIAEAVTSMFGAFYQPLSSAFVGGLQEDTSMRASHSTAFEASGGHAQAAGDVPPRASLHLGEQPMPTHAFHNSHFAAPWMSWGRWGQRVPPPFPFGPPRGPHVSQFPFGSPTPPPAMPGSWHGRTSPGPRPHPPPGPNPPPPNAQPSSALPEPRPSNKSTSQDLRSEVEEAKAQYKAAKERYRLSQQERRKERERVATVESIVPPETPAPPLVVPPVVAVHDKDGNPTHEVVGIRRHQTHLGHSFSKRHDYGSMKARTINRIIKRLADMGFTENVYPDLPSRIRAQLPADSVLSNDAEDNIVTTLLEELLALPPKLPVASGSGLGKGVPSSGWQL